MFMSFDPDHIRKAAAFVEALAELEDRFGYRLAVGVGLPTALGIETPGEPDDGLLTPLVATRGPAGRLQLGIRDLTPAPVCDRFHEDES